MAIGQPIPIFIVIPQPVHLWIKTVGRQKDATHCSSKCILRSDCQIDVRSIENAAGRGLSKGHVVKREAECCYKKDSKEGYSFHARLEIGFWSVQTMA